MKRRKRKIVTGACGLAVLVVALLAGLYWQDILSWAEFVRMFERIGRNEQGLTEYRHRQTGMVFVRVPDGTFWMGTSSEDAESFIEEFGERWRSNLATEQPRHEVTLSPFLIAKYEVKQAEWTRVMGSDPSELPGENLPVERVSWNDCQEFCQKTGLVLPTGAQWEYSCRAGTNTRSAFGDTLTTAQAKFDIRFSRFGSAGYKQQLPSAKAVADAFQPNGFGLYNMHGNVWEWCDDVYDEGFYSRAEANVRDPVCRSGSESRVIRGGCWGSLAGGCRSAQRNHSLPSTRQNVIGFRPAYYRLP